MATLAQQLKQIFEDDTNPFSRNGVLSYRFQNKGSRWFLWTAEKPYKLIATYTSAEDDEHYAEKEAIAYFKKAKPSVTIVGDLDIDADDPLYDTVDN